MTERDIHRAERLMQAHSDGSLTDVMVYGTLATVRSDALSGERRRVAERLREIARSYLVREERAVAEVLSAEADALDALASAPEA